MKNKACFLDRDGVLIEEVNYLSSPDQVRIFPETVKALSLLKNNGYKIIVITNQAGVARGYFTEKDIVKVHAEIDKQLADNNLHIDAYYYCPHHPKGTVKGYNIECECRKPNSNMILQAVKDYNIDLKQSFLIGDKLSDLHAAENAGCRAALVLTGHGEEHINDAKLQNFPILKNIEKAVLHFLN